MSTPKKIRAMSNEVFYPRLKQLAGKKNSQVATEEELEEFRLMWDNADDRATEELGKDEEVNKEERKREREEFKRFLDALDALAQQPQRNRFKEGQKVCLKLNVSPQ